MKKDAYVPMVNPVSSDYYVACHYYPGWPVYETGYSPMADILDFPERTPLLGYYDESNPEVIDWEIKWAREHGINCFIYCWYRKRENLGKKVTKNDLVFAHQLDALFNSRYCNMTDFAIMWEIDNAAGAKDAEDLTENLFPFWADEYFSKPNYMKVDGKPVLFVYDFSRKMIKEFGGPEKLKEAFCKLNEKAKEYGFPGIIVRAEYRGGSKEPAGYIPGDIKMLKEAGYDGIFSYCWPSEKENPTQEEVIAFQMKAMERQIEQDAKFCSLTCSVSWDPTPWRINVPWVGFNSVKWKLTPENWRILLQKTKEKSDSLPNDAQGKNFVIMDNWNEWCEGHVISPHQEYGFEYLKIVREVFTKCDNTPDYRLPKDLGLGPYDGDIKWDAERIWPKF